ncbi:MULTISPECIES: hypothetical protein [Chryseobacterium]|nr:MULTISPECIES: hypothetical protein [unclassified Chryseobacterium]MDC8105567.1 hypothetical protein [Chryseobacterium sp. B21-037]MDQ1806407.1 hypothetical protein [Chryseobacterium sp. CKR4-1]WBV54793.1 hypothetical protein PFY10_11100 [Chryseobacterium daecheongense]
METEESLTKKKRKATGSLENVSSEKTKRKLSDSFIKRIISLLKQEELV